MPHMELAHHQGSTFACMGVHMRLWFAASKGKSLFNRGCAALLWAAASMLLMARWA
ncbi:MULTISPECIES: hypothetical protein [Pseudomonas]|uniref:hypothetical protein n=1 Tax=Pseudomonas TaxID=286 RepID=UPI000A603E1B